MNKRGFQIFLFWWSKW